MNTDALLQGRFKDLANKAYQKNIYTFTNFLSASDLDIFYSILPDINHVPYQIFGGREGCDRVMIRFGSEDMTGYELPFPITILQITPLLDKFSDELTHRDVLGSLMNLGIEREMTGDIVMKESSRSGKRNTAYVFCVSSIADYITDNLTRIKHTNVRCITARMMTCRILYQHWKNFSALLPQNGSMLPLLLSRSSPEARLSPCSVRKKYF